MPENHLFEYAVIRVVPRPEREEFINVGVVVYCRKPLFLQTKFTLNDARLLAMCPDINLEQLRTYLIAFEKIAHGEAGSGPIGQLDPASRFRWLTATRSTVIQSSKIHPGLAKDPLATLNRLHEQMVL